MQTRCSANGIGVYGGRQQRGLRQPGLATSSSSAPASRSAPSSAPRFSGPTLVTRNTLTRAGSFHKDWVTDIGALWIYAERSNITTPVTVSGNTINDSSYQAILMSYAMQISNLLLDHDTITDAGTYGIDIYNVTGSMTANTSPSPVPRAGGLNNPGGYTVNRGAGDTGW